MLLDKYARKVYSQFDGDGVLLELVRRIDPWPSFLEVGSGDGLENNTRILADAGWHGVWIDEMPLALRKTHPNVISIQRRVMRDDFCNPHASNGVFSLDIDGNDYWVWRDWLKGGYKPAIVIIECQLWSGDDYIMPYDPNYVWDHKSHECGAGMGALQKLGAQHGYMYVGKLSNPHDPNLFFVREEYRANVEPD